MQPHNHSVRMNRSISPIRICSLASYAMRPHKPFLEYWKYHCRQYCMFSYQEGRFQCNVVLNLPTVITYKWQEYLQSCYGSWKICVINVCSYLFFSSDARGFSINNNTRSRTMRALRTNIVARV